jgi:hypothetical protein
MSNTENDRTCSAYLTRRQVVLLSSEENKEGEKMTRKDYKLIAARLNEFHMGLELLKDEGSSARLVFYRFMSKLGEDLKRDNSNFDGSVFHAAVYK